MSSAKLDGPGTQKLKTLEDALQLLANIHGVVERMAVEVNAERPIGVMGLQLKRASAPLQGLLKGQFGIIADQVSVLILAAGRGGRDTIRLRALREHVAQIRTAIDINVHKVKEQHAEVGDVDRG